LHLGLGGAFSLARTFSGCFSTEKENGFARRDGGRLGNKSAFRFCGQGRPGRRRWRGPRGFQRFSFYAVLRLEKNTSGPEERLGLKTEALVADRSADFLVCGPPGEIGGGPLEGTGGWHRLSAKTSHQWGRCGKPEKKKRGLLARGRRDRGADWDLPKGPKFRKRMLEHPRRRGRFSGPIGRWIGAMGLGWRRRRPIEIRPGRWGPSIRLRNQNLRAKTLPHATRCATGSGTGPLPSGSRGPDQCSLGF